MTQIKKDSLMFYVEGLKMDPSEVFPAEIIVEYIIPNLDLPEICLLRCVSQSWQNLANLYFARIKVLDVTELKDMLTEFGFQNIAKYLHKLQEIYLDRCWTIATKDNLLQLFDNCPFLKVFSAKRCKFVDDEVLEEMADKCRKLVTINVSYCFQITNTGIIELFRKCNNLSSFNASGNYGFTDDAIQFISKNSISLEELDIGSCFYITDTGLAKLLDGNCKQLSYIRIKGCTKISENMTRRFVQSGVVVNNCF